MAEKRCPALVPGCLELGACAQGLTPKAQGPRGLSGGQPWGSLQAWFLGRLAPPSILRRRLCLGLALPASLLTPGVQAHGVAGGDDQWAGPGRQGSQCRPRTHLWPHVHNTHTHTPPSCWVGGALAL